MGDMPTRIQGILYLSAIHHLAIRKVLIVRCLTAERSHRWEVRKISSLVKQGVDRLDDGADVGFRACAADSRPSSFIGQLAGKMNCDQKNGNLGKKSRNFPRNVQAIQIRHLEVEQNHVGRIFSNPLKGFSAGTSLIADLPGTLLLQQRAKVMPDRRVVIYHKNSNQAELPFLFSG